MKRITVLLLVLMLCGACALAEECKICSGDRICDTCAGLGYLTMKAYGSGSEVRVSCSGGCVDGQCPECYPGCSVCQSDMLCDECGGRGFQIMVDYHTGEEVRVSCPGKHCERGRCAACLPGAASVINSTAKPTQKPTPTPKPTASPTPEPEKSAMDQFIEVLGNIWTEQEMREKPSLEIENLDISSFEQMKVFESLNDLKLIKCTITSLSGLNQLKNLKKLSMVDCVFSPDNPQMLEKAPALTTLVMTGCALEDISFLANASSLTDLYLGNNKISNLKPLSGLKNLKVLSLYDNQITDVSALCSLSTLESINLSGNAIENAHKLAELENVYEIKLSNCGLSDIEFIGEMTGLQYVTLSDNQITDTYPLSRIKMLVYHDLSGNPTTTISTTPPGSSSGTVSLFDLVSGLSVDVPAQEETTTVDDDPEPETVPGPSACLEKSIRMTGSFKDGGYTVYCYEETSFEDIFTYLDYLIYENGFVLEDTLISDSGDVATYLLTRDYTQEIKLVTYLFDDSFSEFEVHIGSGVSFDAD